MRMCYCKHKWYKRKTNVINGDWTYVNTVALESYCFGLNIKIRNSKTLKTNNCLPIPSATRGRFDLRTLVSRTSTINGSWNSRGTSHFNLLSLFYIFVIICGTYFRCAFNWLLLHFSSLSPELTTNARV